MDHTAKVEAREVKLFELYARYVWPLHRLFVRWSIARRCQDCNLSERCSPLDERGQCERCAHPEKETTVAPEQLKTMEDELNQVLAETKGRGRYDALVLYSGGKDSSYLIHLLRTRYPKLRLLAFTFDNTFMSQTALDNISTIIPKLGIDHVTVRPRREFCERVFGYALSHVEKRGCASTVDPIDGALIFDAARHFAAQAKIPLVIIGLSPDQLEQYEGWKHFEANPAFEHSRRTHATVFSIEELSLPEDRSFWWDASRYPEEDVARVLYPFVAWRFDEEFIKNEVTRLGLMASSASPISTNSLLIPLENAIDVNQLGYSSWEPEFTKMIRAGRADKMFWRNTFELVEYAARTGTFINRSVNQALERLHLSRKDVGLPS